MLKIYGFPRSRTSRTLWMAHELDIPYELVRIEVGELGTRSSEFRSLNPHGRVPAIDDAGLVVWESLAINLYLAKRHGGPLAPADLAEDARMTMWSIWAAAELEPDAHEVLLQTVNNPPADRDAGALARALERLAGPLVPLDLAIRDGGGHLVGQRFTVADLNVASVMFYLRAAPEAFQALPAVEAWYRATTNRSAFGRMMTLREQG